MKKKLCTILARGGSKGVKNKNTRILFGKPLIAHTILQAQQSKLFDFIVVSSDSDDILAIAESCKVDLLIKRPIELAMDNSPKIPAIQHAVNRAEHHFNEQFSVIVDLDPTSPLRLVSDIENAYNLFLIVEADNVITACTAKRSPYFNMVELDQDGNAKLPILNSTAIGRRQDAPQLYDMNASIYVWKRDVLLNDKATIWNKKTKLYIMPHERSFDIDSELDFKIVENLFSIL